MKKQTKVNELEGKTNPLGLKVNELETQSSKMTPKGAEDLGFENMMPKMKTTGPELDFQIQIFYFNNSKQVFRSWVAICDERISKTKGRSAIHVFAFFRKNFEDTAETRKWFSEKWKCRLYYGDKFSHKADHYFDIPLNSFIFGRKATFVMMSCFFRSRVYACPSHVSVVPGNYFV